MSSRMKDRSMMISRTASVLGISVLLMISPLLAECPQGDVTGDCRVNFEDLAAMAEDWMMEGSYLLTVKSLGALDVTIASKTGHGGNTNYSRKITVGDEVFITAPATAAGDAFTGWTGDINSTSRSIVFNIEADTTVTARYSMGIDWVYVNDPGVTGHEGFEGYVNKYETTNRQYAQFLNEALASGDIVVEGTTVKGASGSNGGTDFAVMPYYNLGGAGTNLYGAVNGGAAKIHYYQGEFWIEDGFDNYPATYVSWYGATAFCNYYGWRLPTEWEWQAIADYDGSYVYGCGTTIDPAVANYLDTVHLNGVTPVGLFGMSGYGTADTAGNVLEWTSTYMGNGYYAQRGGSWAAGSASCTLSTRDGNTPSSWGVTSGFRVVKNVQP